ncbi:MAG: hypothetical protein LBO21_02100 [Synergistaceae bacterium]|jgi:hypothetical protein|nr:hypothetical protein [Synergistaceae bacterium]
MKLDMEKLKLDAIENEKRMDRKIKNLNSFMSNSKWHKLFKALLENNIIKIQIKFLLSPHEQDPIRENPRPQRSGKGTELLNA